VEPLSAPHLETLGQSSRVPPHMSSFFKAFIHKEEESGGSAMNRIDAMKALDRQMGITEDVTRDVSGDVKDVSGNVLGELRRTAREMELNAICVTAMIQVLESRRSLPQEEWQELVGLVCLRIDALTTSSRSIA